MAELLAYNYAQLDPETNMCIGVQTTSHAADPLPENWVEIPDDLDDYIFKFYINGQWYEDAEGTIPWAPPV